MADFIQTQTTFKVNSYRKEKMGDTDYIVLAGNILVHGVHNGELVEPDELSIFEGLDWNGRPVTINHPEREGFYVSASLQDVFLEERVGWIFNAFADEGQLFAELWVNEDLAKNKKDGISFLQKIARQDTIEVSTGYFRLLEVQDGEFNGKKYYGIARKIRPDHVALLPNSVGACSIKDGCGVRANQEDRMCDKQDDKTAVLESKEVEGFFNKLFASLKDGDSNKNQGEEDMSKDNVQQADMSAVTAEIQALSGDLATLGTDMREAIKETVQPIVERLAALEQESEAVKQAAIDERLDYIAANSDFSREELEGSTETLLAKIERGIKANYAGQGGAIANRENEEDDLESYRPVSILDNLKAK